MLRVLRPENASDATRDTTRLTTCSRASSIAAAAADTDPDLPDVSLQHQEDVAALIEHADALERETAALRGRLAVAEQTERTLRARLGEKDHETHELKTRLTVTGTGGTDRQKASDDESRVASLKARLASSEAELERVRRASRLTPRASRLASRRLGNAKVGRQSRTSRWRWLRCGEGPRISPVPKKDGSGGRTDATSVKDLGFWILDAGFRIFYLGFWVWGFGVGGWGGPPWPP